MPRVHQRFGIGQTESVFKNNSDKEAWLISFRMRLQGSVETTAAPRKCLILSPAWAERNLAERGDCRVCVATTSHGQELCEAKHLFAICCGRDPQELSTHTGSYTLRRDKKSA